jgi:hypothetical protein
MREEKGQVALETLVVFIPWLMVVMMLFNLFFVMGSLVMTQSAVNRAALEAGSYGCLLPTLEKRMQDFEGLGAKVTEVDAVTPPGPAAERQSTWNRSSVLNSDGTIKASAKHLANCSQGEVPNTITSGNYIYLRVAYKQHILFPPVSFDVTRTALVTSSSLEGER